MSAHPSPATSQSPPLDMCHSSSGLFQLPEQGMPYMSSSKLQELQARVLEIFWARYHCLIPIVTRGDFADHEPSGRLGPLQEALVAYCLQSIYYAGLHHRLLGVHKGLTETEDRSAVSQQSPVVTLFVASFQKALAANNHYLLYAEPSLRDIQRHILMALFLLNSGEFLAAYNITGVAIRLAQSLSLQRPPEPHVSVKKAEIRGRIWWTLVHLDFHCSRYLGKPMTACLRETTVALPSPTSGSELASSEPAFHSASILLTVEAKKAAESMAVRQDAMCENERGRTLELCAEYLSQEITRLYQWRDQILCTEPFTNMKLACRTYNPQTRGVTDGSNSDSDAHVYHQSPAHTLQQTLLELQYHDIVIWFHQSFIQFPSRGLVPQRSPKADIHATTALQYALTLTDLVHLRMLNHDTLYGCSDVYQYVWNAALTLIGFMLAYPLCHWFPIARQHVEISLQIFEAGKISNPIASRAARLTEYLLGRVNDLMELLNSQSPLNDRNCPVTASYRGAENRDPVEYEKQSANPLLHDSDYDALWSWADMVDPQTWDGYCDEIIDVLTDLPEIP
ncbi:hypothetical protein PMG11_07662 [Penicillium brasilianum]|uniref:Xylanolytic transcriptional activator regulatory domain-containing protein n=1 Tax=Penicillium brasilianum TaxID=104259 RepID=A0A0F7TUF4_PENBI|nr:hypothetical protein PMG11_07662 [Penicillium brasilianum]